MNRRIKSMALDGRDKCAVTRDAKVFLRKKALKVLMSQTATFFWGVITGMLIPLVIIAMLIGCSTPVGPCEKVCYRDKHDIPVCRCGSKHEKEIFDEIRKMEEGVK